MLPRLVVITDWAIPGIERKLEALAPLGAKVAIQHRAPAMPTREFLARARWLRAQPNPLFINGRLEVALLVDAHLHLPEDAPDVAACRPFLRDKFISVALHEGTPLSRARGADLAIIVPVFAPGSKPLDPRPFLGAPGFRRLEAQLPCPVFALGGITPDSSRALRTAAGLCAISSVLQAADPLAVAKALLAALAPLP